MFFFFLAISRYPTHPFWWEHSSTALPVISPAIKLLLDNCDINQSHLIISLARGTQRDSLVPFAVFIHSFIPHLLCGSTLLLPSPFVVLLFSFGTSFPFCCRPAWFLYSPSPSPLREYWKVCTIQLNLVLSWILERERERDNWQALRILICTCIYVVIYTKYWKPWGRLDVWWVLNYWVTERRMNMLLLLLLFFLIHFCQ